MATPQLTDQEKAALLNILSTTFAGDVVAFNAAALAAYADTQKANFATALTGISLSVPSWAAVDAAIAAGDARVISSVVADLNTALTAHDATNAGALLLVLYAAVKKHFGL